MGSAGAFGDNVADDNPSGLGTFDLPLRLPGQSYDQESRLYYNMARNYGPDEGRYIEADPLGVVTKWPYASRKLNQLYGYVDSSPLVNVDPLGLVKWHGTAFYRGVGPIELDVYTLTSECKCGVEYTVRVSTMASGLSRGGNWVGQLIEFEDPFECPDPQLLGGDYFNVGFSAAGGLGLGFGTTILGAAQSPGSFALQAGVSASAGAVVGKSELDWVIRVPCCQRGR